MNPCARCGQTHRTRFDTSACTGHISTGERAGAPCTKSPIEGGTVCASHGGRAPNVRAAANARLAHAEATRQVATLGLPVDISPTEALLAEVQWTAGHVQWLRGKVQELDQQVTHFTTPEGEEDEVEFFSHHPNHARHGMVWGTTQVVDKRSGDSPGVDTTQAAAPSIWYELYAREREHLVKVCAAALRAGVEERRVRLAEAQGDLVVALLRRVLDALYAALLAAGLTNTQLHDAWTAAVADVVPREIRALAAGGA
jgi:hypothetical protein